MSEALIEMIARAIVDARGEEPEGSQHSFVDGKIHSATFLQIAEHDTRAAIAALADAGLTIVRKDDLHELLRTANDAREALDAGTHYERGAGGMSIEAQAARTFIGNVPARVVEPLHMAIAAFAPDTLED